jgi:DNA-binding CsgD family transcriptional regulator/PAS domain-containing protein
MERLQIAEPPMKTPPAAQGLTGRIQEGLACQFYDAVLEPEKWKGCLSALMSVAGASGAKLIRVEMDGPNSTVLEWVGQSQEAVAAYESRFCRIDPILLMEDRLAVGHWWSDWAVFGPSYAKTEFQHGFSVPFNIHARLIAPLWYEKREAAYIIIERKAEEGSFPAAAPQVLVELLPHLQRVARLHFATRELRAEALLAQRALDHVPVPLFVLQHDGRVLLNNQSADSLIRTSTLVGVNAKLLAARKQQQEVSEAIKRATQPSGATVSWVRLDGERNRSGLMLLVVPLPATSLQARPWQKPLAVMMASRISGGAPSTTKDVLRQVFGLTPAEARVAIHVADGSSLSDISDKFDVALGTVRGQLKAVFQKLGVNRQAELGRLLAGLNTIAPQSGFDDPWP